MSCLLINRESQDLDQQQSHGARVTSRRRATKPSQQPISSSKTVRRVKYIPSQMDAISAITSTKAARENPVRLLFQDALVLLRMLKYLPWLILPFWTKVPDAELYILSITAVRDLFLQGLLFLLEAGILVVAPVLLLILPASVSASVAAFTSVLIYIISRPMLGPRIVYSQMGETTTARAESYKNERWLFVNGCLVGNRILQDNVNRLAKTFGRPVIGIHNRTYGLFIDLLECLIQRCLAFNTMDSRVTYDYVRACLADPTVNRVVLIAHSQGSIIASLVIDRLFADLPSNIIAKLEVYTFGSAASHFNNPYMTLKIDDSSEEAPSCPLNRRCIPYIEHYVNEFDMIPRWGVLYNITQVLDNKYFGKVFVRVGATGHLLNQHYMETMFSPKLGPIDAKSSRSGGPSAFNEFLDRVVDVDEKLAVSRETVARRRMDLMRCEEALRKDMVDFGNGVTVPVGLIINGENNVNAVGGLQIHFVEPSGALKEARGKTVRELSRLWKYMDGGNPASHAPGCTNKHL